MVFLFLSFDGLSFDGLLMDSVLMDLKRHYIRKIQELPMEEKTFIDTIFLKEAGLGKKLWSHPPMAYNPRKCPRRKFGSWTK